MPSAIQPKIIETPGAGLLRHIDPRHVPDRSWSAGRNIRFPTGGSTVRKTDGYQLVDRTTPSEPIMGLWWYVDPDGVQPSALVRIGTTGAWQGLGSARAPIATLTPARTLDDIVTIDQYKGRLIWADGVQVLTWTGTGLATVLGGGAPTAKLVEIHTEHVLLGHVTAPEKAPWRVHWSNRGLVNEDTDAPDFTGDDAGDIDFLDDSTGLTAMKVLGEHVVIHKPNRLYRMAYVGPPDLYVTESIPADEGSISARGAISVGSYQYYIGHTNVFRLGSFGEPIGDAIWPEIAAAIDWPRAHLTYAYRRDQWDEICWKVPARGAAQPNLTVVYNHRDQTWTVTDHDPGTSFTQVPSNALPSTAFDDAHSPVSPPTVRDVFGQADGDIHVYTGRNENGKPIHAWVESKHFTDPAAVAPAKILAIPVFVTGHGTLTVTCRAAMDPRTPMPAWGPGAALALDPAQYRPWVDTRQYGRIWQVRLESNAHDDDWAVAAYGVGVIPGGYAR